MSKVSCLGAPGIEGPSTMSDKPGQEVNEVGAVTRWVSDPVLCWERLGACEACTCVESDVCARYCLSSSWGTLRAMSKGVAEATHCRGEAQDRG